MRKIDNITAIFLCFTSCTITVLFVMILFWWKIEKIEEPTNATLMDATCYSLPSPMDAMCYSLPSKIINFNDGTIMIDLGNKVITSKIKPTFTESNGVWVITFK